MDAADQMIVRYALNQRREHLPGDLASQLDNPTLSAQDLLNALHERASREPALARQFVQLLAQHPYKASVAPPYMPGLRSIGIRGETSANGDKPPVSGGKSLDLKRDALHARIEEAFFPESCACERIDLDTYLKLMQALALAKTLRGLKGVEWSLNQALKG